MTYSTITYKQMAKLLGISVSEAKKIHNSLVKQGYIKELGNGGVFQLTAPDPELAAKIPYNPIRFIP
jgi:Mn-dependent DtxR family transcriptional regulator